MASQELKQRVRDIDDGDGPNVISAASMNDKKKNISGRSRRSMAKRGLRSLVIAVSFPLSLTLLSTYVGWSRHGYDTATQKKPFWFPPMWTIHLTCPACSFLMGLSAWLVWAEGGFHKKPTALWLYLAQLVLYMLWNPIVFGAGASWVGLMVCLGMLGTLVGCIRVFKEVNPIAGELVKACLAWGAFLCIVNLKLLFV